MNTPAQAAREQAGLTLTEAARRARVCPAYLRRIENSGGCSYPLACRLAKLYRCSANVFLQGRVKPTIEIRDCTGGTKKSRPNSQRSRTAAQTGAK